MHCIHYMAMTISSTRLKSHKSHKSTAYIYIVSLQHNCTSYIKDHRHKSMFLLLFSTSERDVMLALKCMANKKQIDRFSMHKNYVYRTFLTSGYQTFINLEKTYSRFLLAAIPYIIYNNNSYHILHYISIGITSAQETLLHHNAPFLDDKLYFWGLALVPLLKL